MPPAIHRPILKRHLNSLEGEHDEPRRRCPETDRRHSMGHHDVRQAAGGRLCVHPGVPDRLSVQLSRPETALRGSRIPRSGHRGGNAGRAVRHLRVLALLPLVRRAFVTLAHIGVPGFLPDLRLAWCLHRHGASQHLAVPAVRTGLAAGDGGAAVRGAAFLQPAREQRDRSHEPRHVAWLAGALPARRRGRGLDRLFADGEQPVGPRVDGRRRAGLFGRQRGGAADPAHPLALDDGLRHLGHDVRAVVACVHPGPALEPHVVARPYHLRGGLFPAQLRRGQGLPDDPLLLDDLQPGGTHDPAGRGQGPDRGRAARIAGGPP